MDSVLLTPENTAALPEQLAKSFEPKVLKDAAQEVATQAAALVLRIRREMAGDVSQTGEYLNIVATAMPVADTKSSAVDPVTIADRKAEEFIRARLHELFPGTHVVGEEAGADPSVEEQAKDSNKTPVGADSLTWVVDPIDGTVNFVYGIPNFAVSLAAVRNGKPIAGAVADVTHQCVYAAAVGEAATVAPVDYETGDRARLGAEIQLESEAQSPSLGEALVATGFSYQSQRRRKQAAVLQEILPKVRDIRRAGSAALDLCMVASGQVDAYYEHGLNSWDFAAGALIAARAGATVSLPDFRRTSEVAYPVIAGRSGVYKELQEALVEANAGGNIDHGSSGAGEGK